MRGENRQSRAAGQVSRRDCVGAGTAADARFRRLMPKRPHPDADSGGTLIDLENVDPASGEDGQGATAVVRVESAADDAPGATAVVRVDRGGDKPAPLPPRRRADPMPSAPRKGLQVSLPEETATKPIPQKPLPPPPPEARGRRGAWWDARQEPLPDEPEPGPDDLPGSTAMVELPAPEPEPEPPPPPPPAEPEVEPYRPVAADDYQGHVPAGPPRWKVLVRRAAWISGGLFALALLALIA